MAEKIDKQKTLGSIIQPSKRIIDIEIQQRELDIKRLKWEIRYLKQKGIK
jgi:hypothetical protein